MSGKPLRTWEEVHAPKKPTADGERFPQRRQPEYVTWYDSKGFPCLVATVPMARGRMGPCGGILEKAHLTSRGAGGKDVGNIVTLCTAHHRRLHTHGQKRFEYELGQKLRPVARRIESGFYAEKKHG